MEDTLTVLVERTPVRVRLVDIDAPEHLVLLQRVRQ
jgi:endonuclease YncB( thermonuclease family)